MNTATTIEGRITHELFDGQTIAAAAIDIHDDTGRRFRHTAQVVIRSPDEGIDLTPDQGYALAQGKLLSELWGMLLEGGISLVE